MLSYSRSWFDSWVDASYGAEGFWRTNIPNAHFRTAASSTSLLAEAVARLLADRPHLRGVVDVGAGSGALLTKLARLRPDLRLCGIDLRPRPGELPAPVTWLEDCWDVRFDGWTRPSGARTLAAGGRLRSSLFVCSEWLDDLPCPVAGKHPDGWREIVVAEDGTERAGPRLSSTAQDWADRWWPTGERSEIGITRDAAWRWIVAAARLTGGAALLIDYGHLADSRPLHGSFTAYRDGRQVPPVPATDLNLTAHVAIDAVQAAGEQAGASTALRALQREAIEQLGGQADQLAPALDRGQTGTLRDLVRRSEHAALTSRQVWGSHWWLLQE